MLTPIWTLFLITLTIGVQAQWNNPLVYYQFDERSGTMVGDSSSNNFDGYANCDNCWETKGKFNGTFHFKGEHKIDLPAKEIALTNKKGTVAFWVLLPQSSINTINCIWWAGEHGGDMFGPHNEMHINSEFEEANIWTGGEIAFVIRDSLAGEGYFIYSDPEKGSDPATHPSGNEITIADGTWHHIACTWESEGTIALYIDGQAIWDTTPYNPNTWNCNLMTIGTANERSNRRLNGYLDEFRIYDEALDAANIADIYNFVPGNFTNSVERIKTPNLVLLNPYPIPAIKNISFNNSIGIETVEIFTITGEKLKVQKISNSTEIVEINIEQLSSGFYIIRAYNNHKLIAVGKFSKK